MPDFILLMHGDASQQTDQQNWPIYLEKLSQDGYLRGGSAIGDGRCFRRQGRPAAMSGDIVGFVRIEARDLAHAESLLAGNPVYEADGTVEIRELPRS